MVFFSSLLLTAQAPGWAIRRMQLRIPSQSPCNSCDQSPQILSSGFLSSTSGSDTAVEPHQQTKAPNRLRISAFAGSFSSVTVPVNYNTNTNEYAENVAFLIFAAGRAGGVEPNTP